VLLFALIAVMWFVFDWLFPAKPISPRSHGDTEN
jgi:hypothetical protein